MNSSNSVITSPLDTMMLFNPGNFTFDLGSQGDTPKLLGGKMEFCLVLLYTVICVAGLVTNIALIFVILGRQINAIVDLYTPYHAIVDPYTPYHAIVDLYTPHHAIVDLFTPYHAIVDLYTPYHAIVDQDWLKIN